MDHRPLGRSGVRVSAIGLGCNQFGGKVPADGVREILAAAADLGINLLDTADVYQEGRSEETIGAALQALGSRDRWVVATKVGLKTGDGPNECGASRWRIRRQVEASLRRLQSDRIDLYQIHEWDVNTPIEETLAALDDLVRAGKIRYAGASNFAAWQLARADALAELRGWSPFVTIQPHYHMFERDVEKELLPLCEARSLGVLPYFPLAGGFLTGKYRRGAPPPAGSRGESSAYVQKYLTPANFDRLERLEAWARKRDRSMGELAIAWLLARRCVSSVISGATSPAQVRENARAASWTLSPEDLKEIEG
jgi:aryl-alcohol dehydrogenase-like predicted oxidoreductase